MSSNVLALLVLVIVNFDNEHGVKHIDFFSRNPGMYNSIPRQDNWFDVSIYTDYYHYCIGVYQPLFCGLACNRNSIINEPPRGKTNNVVSGQV